MKAKPAKNKAIFLDRDGVINVTGMRNGRPFAPQKVEDFTLSDGVEGALRRLKDAGFLLIVVTNQPDVIKESLKKSDVETMHMIVRQKLPIDDVYVCFHIDEDECDCRKPKPGMLLEAAKKWNISMAESFMVGDRWSDVDAGRSAKCKTVWIDANYAEPRAEFPDWTVKSVVEAAEVILKSLV